MSEVEFRIDFCFSWNIQKVFCQWKWIMIFLGHFIETMEINTKMKIAILFPDKEHQSSVWRMAWMYKSDVEMLVQKLAEFMEFRLQQGVNCTQQRGSALHEVDF